MQYYHIVTKVGEYTVPDVGNVHHFSYTPNRPGKLWVSDKEGKLVLLDQQTRKVSIIQTSQTGGWEWHGFHTVTNNGDLIYIDRSEADNVIMKRPLEDTKKKDTFTTTGDWAPLSIHSSRRNGDVLVGMIKNDEARVTRYTSDGIETEGNHITLENGSYPHYITESDMNVYITDYCRNTILVMNNLGEQMFSYNFNRGIIPYGLQAFQTNAIFVCCVPKRRNQNRTIPPLMNLLTHHREIETTPLYPTGFLEAELRSPSALFCGHMNRLHVGESNTNRVKIFQVNRHSFAYDFRRSTLARRFTPY